MKKLRSILKTTILVASLAESLLRFNLLRLTVRLRYHRFPTPLERATWLHGCCRRILHRLGIQLAVNGALPICGLIVSNHLSHMDILLYGALGPIIFVSKEDVRSWPLLGKLAENGGTVFVDRERPAQAAEAARQIEEYLRGNIPVLLFPEGTSTDGSRVLPFRSPLFEPALRAACEITAAAIGYSADGVDESTLAYYGDKVFFPHLSATLGCRNLASRISFSASRRFDDRKEAARATHKLVEEQRLAKLTPLPEQSRDYALRI